MIHSLSSRYHTRRVAAIPQNPRCLIYYAPYTTFFVPGPLRLIFRCPPDHYRASAPLCHRPQPADRMLFAHAPRIQGTHRTPAAAQVHRNLTSPPSLWPGRESRKYHCPLSRTALLAKASPPQIRRVRSTENVSGGCLSDFQGSQSLVSISEIENFGKRFVQLRKYL